MTFGTVPWAGAPFGASSSSAAATADDFPDISLQIAFTTAPGSTAPAWVDVSTINGLNRIRAGEVTRGRQRELDKFQPGRATFTLSNADRAFDPTYSGGPYPGNVLPMRRIRCLATYAGVTYPLFDGYIDSIEQTYENPRDSVAIISATDATKILAAAQLPDSVYVLEVAADNPIYWWRLGEPTGSTIGLNSAPTNIGGQPNITYVGGVTFGAQSQIVNDPNTGITLDGSTGYLSAGAVPVIRTFPYSIEMWLKISDRTGILGQYTFFGQNIGGSPASARPKGQVQGSDIGNTGQLWWDSIQGTTRVDDNAWHHVVLTVDSGGVETLYIDGAVVDTGVASTLDAAANEVLVGHACPPPSFALSQNFWPGGVDEFAIYNTCLSAARVAVHNSAGRTPWAGDTPGQRIGRVLDYISWPAGLRELDTGSSVLQSATIGDTVLAHIQAAGAAEFGESYPTAAGVVRFEGRTAKVNGVNYGTFGDGAGEIGYADIVPDYSDQLIRNDVTISRTQGVAQNSKDATSISAYLTHSYVVDGLIHNSDQLSRDAADFFVSEYKAPLLRFTQLTVKSRRSPSTMFPAVLPRELTDKITVKRRPQTVGSPISQDSIIEGINHRFAISQRTWETRFNVSPAFAGSFLELDTGNGRIATAGAQLAGSLNAVSLTFNVTLTGGDLFTTAGGDFPFDITVGAEVMTATAISGASSPQQFTVTRANPTTHAAGEAVQVADPVRLYF